MEKKEKEGEEKEKEEEKEMTKGDCAFYMTCLDCTALQETAFFFRPFGRPFCQNKTFQKMKGSGGGKQN